MASKFDSVNDVVNYLLEPMLSPTVTGSGVITNGVKSSKKQRKEDLKSAMSTTPLPSQLQSEENIEILPKGRVRYGPITVNPRKQPSKTLFTGRRSKYEVLSADEEEKRRDRRERNKVAATKCREKRETVLGELENKYNDELHAQKQLIKTVYNLEERKKYLESAITNHFNECPLLNPPPSMIFGDTSFLASIIEAPAPPLPSYQEPIFYSEEEEEELSQMLFPTSLLTNSAYNTNDSNSVLIPQQQIPSLQPMTNSSIERILNNLQTPTVSMESAHSMLFNSAVGSSCAKQHSNSSEDDSLPPKHTNPYVY